jgi:hypothetical protein
MAEGMPSTCHLETILCHSKRLDARFQDVLYQEDVNVLRSDSWRAARTIRWDIS